MAKASGTAAVGEGLRRGMGHGCMCYVLETVDATLNALPGVRAAFGSLPSTQAHGGLGHITTVSGLDLNCAVSAGALAG